MIEGIRSAALRGAVPAVERDREPHREDTDMSGSSEDKETVRRLFDAFDAVDADTMRELLSPGFVAHSMPPGFSKDREGFLELARQWRLGFGQEDATVDELLAAEDGKAPVRFTSRAPTLGMSSASPPATARSP